MQPRNGNRNKLKERALLLQGKSLGPAAVSLTRTPNRLPVYSISPHVSGHHLDVAV